VTEALITAGIVVTTWIVFLTGFIVKLQMRIKTLEELHTQCQERRIYLEDLFLDRVAKIQSSLDTVKNDIQCIKAATEKNGGSKKQ
jgi:hypothetical protein